MGALLATGGLYGVGLAAAPLAGASGVAVAVPNELVVPGVGASSCNAAVPAGDIYTNIQSAVNAAASGDTIYVCPGSYDLSDAAYPNEQVTVTTANLTLEGPGVIAPSVPNPATQAVLVNGAGIQDTADGLTVEGLTFSLNNGGTACKGGPCTDAIYAPYGQNGVVVRSNLFSDVGLANGYQNGVVHLGNANGTENTGNVIADNVFVSGAGYENNQIVAFDQAGLVVSGNTVTYTAAGDANAVTALYFGGYNANLLVEQNSLSGGGTTSANGISYNDDFGGGNVGSVFTQNTISGFNDGIAVTNRGVSGLFQSAGPSTVAGIPSPSAYALCNPIPNTGIDRGPIPTPDDFTVSNNTITGSHHDGIAICDAFDGTISGNSVSGSTTYDYYDSTYGLLESVLTSLLGTPQSFSISFGTLNNWLPQIDANGSTSNVPGLLTPVSEGSQGPTGPAGPPGPQGPAGPVTVLQTTPVVNPTPVSPPTTPAPTIITQQGSGGPNTPAPQSTTNVVATPKVTSITVALRWSVPSKLGRSLKLEATTVPTGHAVTVQSCWWIKPKHGTASYHMVGCGHYSLGTVYHLTSNEAIKSRAMAHDGVTSQPLVLVG